MTPNAPTLSARDAPTPRTDAFEDTCGDYEKPYRYTRRLADFARGLERETSALRTALTLTLGKLRAKADSIYCRAAGDAMSKPALMGAEAKLTAGEFGLAELNAHKEHSRMMASHFAIQAACDEIDALLKGTNEMPSSARPAMPAGTEPIETDGHKSVGGSVGGGGAASPTEQAKSVSAVPSMTPDGAGVHEAVLWQLRYRHDDGSWSSWCDARSESELLDGIKNCRKEGITDYETRALYASPAAALTAPDVGVLTAEMANDAHSACALKWGRNDTSAPVLDALRAIADGRHVVASAGVLALLREAREALMAGEVATVGMEKYYPEINAVRLKIDAALQRSWTTPTGQENRKDD